MENWVEPIALERDLVKLEPISTRHKSGLAESVADGELWKLCFTSVPSPTEIDRFAHQALQLHETAEALVFAVRLKSTGDVVGSTRCLKIDNANRRLEIGYTWYAERYQRTVVNTACKYLLLAHAFDEIDAIAVELRTHWMNPRSRAAIERLGASGPTI